eukprot:6214786-Pleurochrysis_carterae.AAC.2
MCGHDAHSFFSRAALAHYSWQLISQPSAALISLARLCGLCVCRLRLRNEIYYKMEWRTRVDMFT